MECSTTTYLPRLALLAGLTCGLPATAQSPLLMNAFEVDRAGTTLVGGARTTLIDRNGNVIACIAEQSPARRWQDWTVPASWFAAITTSPK